MANSAVEEYTPIVQVGYLQNSDGINYATIPAGKSNGWRFDVMIASNTDTIDHNLNLRYSSGGNFVYLGTVKVPAGAGQGLVPAVDVIGSLAGALVGGIVIGGSDGLSMRVEETITSPDRVSVLMWGGSF